jgi:hypothetical protein
LYLRRRYIWWVKAGEGPLRIFDSEERIAFLIPKEIHRVAFRELAHESCSELGYELVDDESSKENWCQLGLGGFGWYGSNFGSLCLKMVNPSYTNPDSTYP